VNIPHQQAVEPQFDCFYVYPTCSLDSSPNSDWNAEEEAEVAHLQAARLQSVCRVFAPIYRQITIGGLFSRREEANEVLAYGDVETAFETYLDEFNGGRGILLIGHSQGTAMLIQLLKEHFDNHPHMRDQLIAAYLIGLTVDVPVGESVGGTFQNLPLCTGADETGCIITYATYRASNPPGPSAVFGTTQNEGMEAGCTDPGALLGETDALDSIFPSALPTAYENLIVGNVSPFADPESAPTIDTGFFSVPGLASGQCVRNNAHHYLSIEVNADPTDPRADDVGGDLILPGWGLHLVDVNLVMGQLERLITRQADAYVNRTATE